MDARKHARYSVRFKSQFSAAQAPEGAGIITDLARGGCRVTSMMTVPPGTEMKLRILIEEGGEIEISRALSRWVRGMEFGVEFLETDPGASEQLHQLLKSLGDEG